MIFWSLNILLIILLLSLTYVFFRLYKSLVYRCKHFFLHKVVANPHFQILGQYYYRINTTKKIVALTFDDGPLSPYTEELLNVLESNKIKATFYFKGENIERYFSTAKLVFEKGHQIGNHSYSHPAFLNLTLKRIRDEIEKTDELIRKLGVTNEITFRAPYGKKFIKLPLVLKKLKKKHILFDFFPMPRDWLGAPADQVASSIIQQTRPGSIIVLHDGNEKAAPFVCEYTQRVISGLKSMGYSFSTIDELLLLSE